MSVKRKPPLADQIRQHNTYYRSAIGALLGTAATAVVGAVTGANGPWFEALVGAEVGASLVLGALSFKSGSRVHDEVEAEIALATESLGSTGELGAKVTQFWRQVQEGNLPTPLQALQEPLAELLERFHRGQLTPEALAFVAKYSLLGTSLEEFRRTLGILRGTGLDFAQFQRNLSPGLAEAVAEKITATWKAQGRNTSLKCEIPWTTILDEKLAVGSALIDVLSRAAADAEEGFRQLGIVGSVKSVGVATDPASLRLAVDLRIDPARAMRRGPR